jgi:menaquinone-specific isochorismate synthase
VGGYPAKASIEAIRRTERFDRGWYAGPVGWVSADEADFAVALRCGLVRGSELNLYSGAGIVEGSVPDLEWDEIEHKIVDFANVLGLIPVSSE